MTRRYHLQILHTLRSLARVRGVIGLAGEKEALARGESAVDVAERRAVASRLRSRDPGRAVARTTTAGRELRGSYYRLRLYREVCRRAVELREARDGLGELRARVDRSRDGLAAACAEKDALERHHAAWRADLRVRRRAREQADDDDR